MRSLDERAEINKTMTEPDFDIGSIVVQWVAHIRREYAHNIQGKIHPSCVRSTLENEIERLYKEMKTKTEEADKTGNKIRIAYDTQEGTEARSWAELMLKAWSGEDGK